ncbi:MAG TPA: hypothetical protein VKS80_03690 [Trinickia sp.]|nr:hypothetical protein [Trinickia sp.]
MAALLGQLQSIIEGAREKAASDGAMTDEDLVGDDTMTRVDVDEVLHIDAVADRFGVEIVRCGDAWQLSIDTADRAWIVNVREHEGLVQLRSGILELPDAPAARAAVVEAAMRANAQMELWRFAIGEENVLSIDAAIARHGSDISQVLALIEAIERIEPHCETLRRIAATPAALHALEAAFKRNP